jgi:hypothetical protein
LFSGKEKERHCIFALCGAGSLFTAIIHPSGRIKFHFLSASQFAIDEVLHLLHGRLPDRDEMPDLFWVMDVHFEEIENVAQRLDGIRETA